VTVYLLVNHTVGSGLSVGSKTGSRCFWQFEKLQAGYSELCC